MLAAEFTPYLPQIKIKVKHARREQIVERAMFSQYLFVEEHDEWRRVATMRGVLRFLGPTLAPSKVSAEVIGLIRSQEADDGYIRLQTHDDRLRPRLRAGQRLRVIDGPFTSFPAEYVGLFDPKDEDRIKVLVDIFGRKTQVEVKRDGVEPAV